MLDDLAEQATASSLLLVTRYPVDHPVDGTFSSWKKNDPGRRSRVSIPIPDALKYIAGKRRKSRERGGK